MTRPVIGIIGNSYMINDQYPAHAAGAMCVNAIAQVADALPLIVAADTKYFHLDALMDTCHGFLFTGGRPNIHPEEYGHYPTEKHGAFDRCRDRLAIPLIRACIDRGQPVFGICRGFQEINVAMGGTLHPEIREIEGRDNHRMPPDGTLEEKFALRHDVHLTPGGPFARLLGSDTVFTNTLHGQGILDAGKRIVIDGHAPDGTPEAIYVADAPGFALAVQWHPEWQADTDPVSRPLFEAFGAAARDWAAGRRPLPVARSA